MSVQLGTFETILLAELRVGLPPLFYTRFLEISDDWTFVLKLHAFFEGILTKLVQRQLSLAKNYQETMTPRDSFVSRVHLAERLRVMEPDYREFLLALNRLRNDLTHNIGFIAFQLEEYVDELSDLEFRRRAKTLGAGFKNVTMDEFIGLLLGERPAGNAEQVKRMAAPAEHEMVSKFLGSIAHREKRKARECQTVREFFWLWAPKASIWYAGVWTLDMLSLHLHLHPDHESDTQTWRFERDMEPKLQDLLHDPAVLEYKRKIDGLWPRK